MIQILQNFKTGEMLLEEVPRPQVVPGMILVETKASVVSAGTERMTVDLAQKSLLGKARARPDLVRKVLDAVRKEGLWETLQMVKTGLDTPIPLGYSCAGVVREIGGGVTGVRIGDAVACGGGGYANHSEYNVIPKNLFIPVPGSKLSSGKTLTWEEAAFATIGAIALQGVRQARLTLGERVGVIGLGLIGQITVQLCKASGCRVIGADVDHSRIELAEKGGADQAVHSADLEKAAFSFTQGVGLDAVIITAAAKGSELVALAGEISRLKGRIVAVGLVGLDVPRGIYFAKELELRLSMSYGPGRYDAEYEERGHDYPVAYVRWSEQRNMEAFLELAVSGQVDVKSLITHRFSFDKALDAYQLLSRSNETPLGVVLNYAAAEEPSRIIVRSTVKGQETGRVGIGFIGAGNFARNILLPRLNKMEKVDLCGVATGKGVSAKGVAGQFGFSYCCEDPAEVIEDPEVHAVFIATRHDSHGAMVKRALTAGKHVFVEKPLCTDPEELQQIETLLRDRAKNAAAPILMVGFNRRFAPFIAEAGKIFADRGTPMVISYRVNAGLVPKDSWIQDPMQGGRIVGEVCHFVDTLRFLVGSPVRAVQAACVKSANHAHTDRDSVAITLTYDDGSLGTILYYALGTNRYPKEKLEIIGEQSIVDIDDYRTMKFYSPKKTEKKRTKQNKGHPEEITHFAEAIAGKAPPPIPLADILESTRVTFAIHRALETGQTVRFDSGQNPLGH